MFYGNTASVPVRLRLTGSHADARGGRIAERTRTLSHARTLPHACAHALAAP